MHTRCLWKYAIAAILLFLNGPFAIPNGSMGVFLTGGKYIFDKLLEYLSVNVDTIGNFGRWFSKKHLLYVVSTSMCSSSIVLTSLQIRTKYIV